MQNILDRKYPPDLSGSSDYRDSDDMDAPTRVNSNYQQAIEEVNDFELFKKTEYLIILKQSTMLKGNGPDARSISAGPIDIVKLGKNLLSKNNLIRYIGDLGCVDLVSFFNGHQKSFTTL